MSSWVTLAIMTQIVVFPLFGIDTGLTEHLTIGLAFVGVSLLRGYLLRRFFEAIAHDKLLLAVCPCLEDTRVSRRNGASLERWTDAIEFEVPKIGR